MLFKIFELSLMGLNPPHRESSRPLCMVYKDSLIRFTTKTVFKR